GLIMKHGKIYLSIAILLFSTKIFAVDTTIHTGKVTEIASFPKVYGNYSNQAGGLLAIYVEGLPSGCGNGLGRVVIGVEHPMYESVLSIALYAKASGNIVEVSYFEE